MKRIYTLSVIVLGALVIGSCKKVIDLNLADTTPQLVIEGNVTDQQGIQTVKISRSVAFDNTNTFPAVSGATVKIIDDKGGIRNLTETTPGVYTVNSYSGRPDRTYTLTAQVNGQTYTARSTMPAKVTLDSISLSEQTFARKTTKTVTVFYQDPPVIVNQYRIILYINNQQVKEVFVRNDQFGDGRMVQALLYQNDVEIKSGDLIDVEMQCIDQPVYLYWYTFAQQQSNRFNNSATPSNPPNNFDKSVLGYFSVHTTQRKTIYVN